MKIFTRSLIIFLTFLVLVLFYNFFPLEKGAKDCVYNSEAGTSVAVKKTSRFTYLYLNNVNFYFTKNIKVFLKGMTANIYPIKPGTCLLLDDINSLEIKLLNGIAKVTSEDLKTIFSDYVFNFEDSPLKLESIDFIHEFDGEKGYFIKLKGKLKFGLWLSFEMISRLEFLKSGGRISISAQKIKVLGLPFGKSLLSLVGLSLEKLISVPAGRGVTLKKNTILVTPLDIFPPPRLVGRIGYLKMIDDSLILGFNGKKPPGKPKFLKKNAKNFVFMSRGKIQMKSLLINESSMQLIDQDPKDFFDFSLKQYISSVTTGAKTYILPDMSILMYVRDYTDIIKQKN